MKNVDKNIASIITKEVAKTIKVKEKSVRVDLTPYQAIFIANLLGKISFEDALTGKPSSESSMIDLYCTLQNVGVPCDHNMKRAFKFKYKDGNVLVVNSHVLNTAVDAFANF